MFAVSSPFVRSTTTLVRPYMQDNQIVVDITKGIEAENLMILTEVIENELLNETVKVVALSGTTHAEQVAIRMPTTILLV